MLQEGEFSPASALSVPGSLGMQLAQPRIVRRDVELTHAITNRKDGLTVDRSYLIKVVLFYLVLGLLITANRFYGGAISGDFQFFANLILLLIAAVSIVVLPISRLRASRNVNKDARASAREELTREIVKKVAGGPPPK